MKIILRHKTSRKKYVGALNLLEGKAYPVMGIESDSFRVIDETGEPVLFPPHLFEIIDTAIPDDWLVEKGDGGELYAYPEPLNRPGFFEDYFDGDKMTRDIFWRVAQQAGVDSLHIHRNKSSEEQAESE